MTNKLARMSLLTCLTITFLLAGSPKHHLFKPSESMTLNRSPVIITKLDNAHEFRSVEITVDSVVGYSKGGKTTNFSRNEIAYIHEIHSNYFLYTLFGGLVFGSLGYFSTPDESDALAQPKLWGIIYGSLGAGLGFAGAVSTSGIYTYYFDKELYSKYSILE